MRRDTFLPGLVMGLILLSSVGGSADEPYRGKVFLGLGTKTVELPEGTDGGSKFGQRVTRVAVGSSAEKAGLHIGDIIVGLNDIRWADEKAGFRGLFYHRGLDPKVGQTYTLHVLRRDPADADAPARLITVPFELTRYPRTTARQPLRRNVPASELPEPNYKRLVTAVISDAGLEADADDLLLRLARGELYADPERLPVVTLVRQFPFDLETVARRLARPPDAPEGQTDKLLQVFMDAAWGNRSFSGEIDCTSPNTVAVGTLIPEMEGTDLNAHLKHMELILGLAAGMNARGIGGLGDE